MAEVPAVPAIAFRGITKQFPGVTALDDVSFEIGAGNCHAICGENGAGKSTLGKILAGMDQADGGSIALFGREVHFESPRDALAAGVAMVHQELAFCDNMTVAENLCLGALPSRFGRLDREELRRRARRMLAAVGAEGTDPDRSIESLGIAEQQVVQIAAAVGSGARVIVFDEPTSSLGETEAERLFALLGRLRADGVTVLYVSHRMPEIFRLCDAVTVLRDGRHVMTQPTGTVDEATLVQRMIGRRLEQYFPAHVGSAAGDEVLRVEHLTVPGQFQDVSFSLKAGEVLGLAGLVGAGRSEVARAIFGLEPAVRGSVYLRGRLVRVRSPREAMALGIGLVPEDRKRQGLVLGMAAGENTSLPTLTAMSRWGWVNRRLERTTVGKFFERLRVRDELMDAPAAAMSGGNQQKVVLAKWLAARSRVLMLDEPTRGVDVGAKEELHAWIDTLAGDGTAVLLISSELPELINLSTRIVVLREGRVVGEVAREDATQDVLLRLMAGLSRGQST